MGALQDRVYVITGGSGALARGVREAFEAEGARIALVDRHRPEGVADTEARISLALDVLDPTAVEQGLADVRARMGRLDGVIHTVGGFTWGKVATATPADYDRMFDLNIRSLFYVTRAALPHLLEQQGGLLCGIASVSAWKGGAAGTALYSASKAAVATYLRSLDGELEGTDVRVCVCYPMGVLDTPANRAAMPDVDPATWIDVTAIGRALAFAASQDPRGRILELPVYPRR